MKVMIKLSWKLEFRIRVKSRASVNGSGFECEAKGRPSTEIKEVNLEAKKEVDLN